MTSHPHPPRTSPIFLSGLAAALFFWLSMAFGLIMDFGGGSFAKGLPIGISYLSLYGIFFCFPALAVGFVAILLSKLLGLRVTYVLIGCGALAMVIHSAITSRPGAQLERVAGLSNKTEIPPFDYLEFKQYPTFSDGTTYSWQIRCNPEDAKLLASLLGLMPIPRESDTSNSGIFPPYPSVLTSAFESVFEQHLTDEIHYTDNRSFVGGFSPTASIFRLAWFPEHRLAPAGNP